MSAPVCCGGAGAEGPPASATLKPRTACSCRIPAERSAAMNRITPIVTTVTRPITKRMYIITAPPLSATLRQDRGGALDVLVGILPIIGVRLWIAQHYIARPGLCLNPRLTLRPPHREADADEPDATDLADVSQIGDPQAGTGEEPGRWAAGPHPAPRPCRGSAPRSVRRAPD